MSVEALYQKLSGQHKSDLKALGWSSVESQLKRFSVLSEALVNPEGQLLDVGCGFGDFSLYFQNYTGIDNNKDFIAEAERKYPTKAFICADFFKHVFNNKFDYVIGNGVLAYQANPVSLIQRMWDFTTDTLAFTWLDATRNDINLVLGMCGCEFYMIRHDFLPNDTAIFMYKDPR